jgi:cytoskeletal protein RodZ
MHVSAPVYEKPSQLSQGLVIGLSIAVVLMAGWLAMTIMFSDSMRTAAEDGPETVASTPIAASPPPADKLPRNPGTSPARATASSNMPVVSGQAARSVQFDWPAEFDVKQAPAQTALPFAPIDLPATHDAGPWPAATAVPDNARAFAATRRPQSQAGAATSTSAVDAIVELLSPPPPSGFGPSTRTAPVQRQ